MKQFYPFILILLIFSCQRAKNTENTDNLSFKNASLLYAKGFEIARSGTIARLSVNNPWQNAKNISYQYYLIDKKDSIPQELINQTVIRTPVRKVVCLSTTHLGFLDYVGEINSLSGVASADFVYNPKIRQMIKNQQVTDVGYDNNLNYELLLKLRADVVFIYGVTAQTSALIDKLKQLGITAVITAEYLETQPLGKAEWVKFFAEFFKKKASVNKKFLKTAETYGNLKQKVNNASAHPQVLTGLPWKGVWYISGGKSYAAQLIKDAGGDFLWHENQSSEALPLGLEHIFAKAKKADFWINCGAANSLNDIKAVDERLQKLVPYQRKTTYNNNARLSPNGGNDYWESGVVQPELILKDLLHIFHPQLLPDHQLLYYQKVM